MDVSLSCTAEGLPWLWVLHGAIEKTMLSQAKANISALIDFFQTEVDSGALTKKPQPVSPFLSASPSCMLAADRNLDVYTALEERCLKQRSDGKSF